MRYIINSIILFCFILGNSIQISAAPSSSEKVNNGKQKPKKDISSKIGVYGEAEEIPDGFQFAEAENLIWLNPHLDNIKEPLSLYYEFVKSGSFEEGFIDSVYLNILSINNDGTKNTTLDFFTADRKQFVSSDNVTNVIANPVLGIYMQGDVYEMSRLTGGHWRHFQKQIKISLRKDANVEDFNFNFNGKEYKGKKVYFYPYLEDPHRPDFEKFANKYYEFIFSEELPAKIYQIKTVISDNSKEEAEPLLIETLTLINVKKMSLK